MEVVRVERLKIPDNLLADCPSATIPADLTFGDAVGLWADDRRCVATLAGQIEAIRVLNDGTER